MELILPLNTVLSDAGAYSVLHQNIQDKFNEEGVEITSPHYTSLLHVLVGWQSHHDSAELFARRNARALYLRFKKSTALRLCGKSQSIFEV